jgi:recombination protein RecA
LRSGIAICTNVQVSAHAPAEPRIPWAALEGSAGPRRLVSVGGSAEPTGARTFSLQALAGRFVELSGAGASAVLTVAMQLVWEAQHHGENVAWVGVGGSTFFAPDAARAGIDLAALPVVMAPDVLAAGRAVSHLLRSGAFGLVVLDLAGLTVGREIDLPMPLQSRLTGLAQKHGSVLVALTSKDADQASLGSLVSLHASVRRDGEAAGVVHVDVTKDKRHGPGWSQRATFHGPAGFR